MMTIEQAIECAIPDQDQFIVGYADMEQLLHFHYKFNFAVSIAIKVGNAVMDRVANEPTQRVLFIKYSRRCERKRVSSSMICIS